MMKVLVSIALLAAAALAEPPRYPQYQQQRQYYFARQQEEAANNPPYAASGWKPAGPTFDLPARQSAGAQRPQQQYEAPSAAQQPQQQYAAPQQQQQYGAPDAAQQPQQQYEAPSAQQLPRQQYGAPATPQQQYGAPTSQEAYGVPEESTTTERSSDEEEVSTVQGISSLESEATNAANELDEEEQDEKQQPQQSGEYYVALPDGRLQRVQYVSRQDVEAMRYFAKIRAENVEPLRGPIYAYAPLQKLQILPASLQVSVAPIAAVAPAERTSKPQKLEIEPVATQVQYQYDNPSGVVPLASPLSSAYTANYQVPAADSRFLLTFQ